MQDFILISTTEFSVKSYVYPEISGSGQKFFSRISSYLLWVIRKEKKLNNKNGGLICILQNWPLTFRYQTQTFRKFMENSLKVQGKRSRSPSLGKGPAYSVEDPKFDLVFGLLATKMAT